MPRSIWLQNFKTGTEAGFHTCTQSAGQDFNQRVDGFVRSPKALDFPDRVQNGCMVTTAVKAADTGCTTWKPAG
jgi:hypothetical protein